jgi:transcriptional regulator with XRE-family HTH domain
MPSPSPAPGPCRCGSHGAAYSDCENGHHAQLAGMRLNLGATNRHRSLRALRERAGLTPGRLAERLGVTHLTIQSWEKGERPVRKGWRFKLADALGCSVADVRQPEDVARGKRWRQALVKLSDAPLDQPRSMINRRLR